MPLDKSFAPYYTGLSVLIPPTTTKELGPVALVPQVERLVGDHTRLRAILGLTMHESKVLHDGIILSELDLDLFVYPLSGSTYARCWFNGKRELLHRAVMRKATQVELPKHLVIDHINNNPLDNRRENLQFLWHNDNVSKGHSKTTYLRVGYRKETNRWRVRFSIEGRQEEYGTYKTAQEAAFMADVWAYRLLPDGCLFNFPERLDEIKQSALLIDNPNHKWRRNI